MQPLTTIAKTVRIRGLNYPRDICGMDYDSLIQRLTEEGFVKVPSGGGNIAEYYHPDKGNKNDDTFIYLDTTMHVFQVSPTEKINS